MMLTIWTRQGKKTTYLPSESIDEVKKMLYTNKDNIIEYCIGYTENERGEINDRISEKCD
ncbi:hypothetical protein CMI47_07710 [Candidatus Pacearchaeota archaeon]|nr:hypothetical protein [Candidatus Pacearchaeota archaeon]|tara:strand:- start:1012 stop:1191 length:180 start_codon:yes stop_codon:yes gene_type:complete